jgi:NADH-quinone oxidoreductase subunit D
MQTTQYKYSPEYLSVSEPTKYKLEELAEGEMILNLGPQHPSTHGVLRLEVKTDGELVQDVVPHIGYLHRCFEKHAEKLPFNQIIPFVDRLDYAASMNSEHAYVMGVERMLGIENTLPKRIEYIRVLVAELNRIASHFLAIGTYALDIGAQTPFLWVFRDRETILRLLEWLSGSRLLYNYIWVGGLFYDLPIGFEEKVAEFIKYLKPKMIEMQQIIIDNHIFISRTANVGVLELPLAISHGCSGPVLRGSGLRYDLRRVDGYSVYPELEFSIPIGEGKMGKLGDCWDRNYVRVQECWESVHIIEQCVEVLTKKHPRTKEFNPHAFLPKKIRPEAMEFYARAENSKGELGFYFKTNGKSDIPERVKCRSCSFHNLSVLPQISKGVMIADLVAIIGSLDMVMGEVDR